MSLFPCCSGHARLALRTQQCNSCRCCHESALSRASCFAITSSLTGSFSLFSTLLRPINTVVMLPRYLGRRCCRAVLLRLHCPQPSWLLCISDLSTSKIRLRCALFSFWVKFSAAISRAFLADATAMSTCTLCPEILLQLPRSFTSPALFHLHHNWTCSVSPSCTSASFHHDRLSTPCNLDSTLSCGSKFLLHHLQDHHEEHATVLLLRHIVAELLPRSLEAPPRSRQRAALCSPCHFDPSWSLLLPSWLTIATDFVCTASSFSWISVSSATMQTRFVLTHVRIGIFKIIYAVLLRWPGTSLSLLGFSSLPPKSHPMSFPFSPCALHMFSMFAVVRELSLSFASSSSLYL